MGQKNGNSVLNLFQSVTHMKNPGIFDNIYIVQFVLFF